ncbi:hypothetical protein HMPREF9498_01409 [Enterococcus faecalis TX4248]|uniref:Uncharacterized protein n=1 Tax=Enterococcus faecalis TX4248 TaxID=749495 RepID=A0A125W6F0_ENTFL|nr:hypothetical protein HMPREF9498_01409 [Enterococcus faecalis TX4248]
MGFGACPKFKIKKKGKWKICDFSFSPFFIFAQGVPTLLRLPETELRSPGRTVFPLRL